MCIFKDSTWVKLPSTPHGQPLPSPPRVLILRFQSFLCPPIFSSHCLLLLSSLCFPELSQRGQSLASLQGCKTFQRTNTKKLFFSDSCRKSFQEPGNYFSLAVMPATWPAWPAVPKTASKASRRQVLLSPNFTGKQRCRGTGGGVPGWRTPAAPLLAIRVSSRGFMLRVCLPRASEEWR